MTLRASYLVMRVPMMAQNSAGRYFMCVLPGVAFGLCHLIAKPPPLLR